MPVGTVVPAYRKGVVAQVGRGKIGGNYLYLQHTASDGSHYQTKYMHLADIRGITVGQSTDEIRIISGSTASFGSEPHLHFELWRTEPERQLFNSHAILRSNHSRNRLAELNRYVPPYATTDGGH